MRLYQSDEPLWTCNYPKPISKRSSFPKRVAVSRWFWVWMMFWTAVFAAHSEDLEILFSIPDGPAKSTLRIAAEQADIDLMFRMNLVEGVWTPAIQGRYTVEQAFAALLSHSKLELFEDRTTRSFAIIRTESGSYREVRKTEPEKPKNETTDDMKKNNIRKSGIIGAIFSAVFATGSIAQNVDIDDEDVYEMSPFTVSVEDDRGYLASNTLAGSRLNTSLGDTAAPISVFTKEFLEDLAANDTQTATFYAVNAEEFTEAEIGDQTGNQLQNDGLQFNLRGFKTSGTRNFFNWGLNTDNYNADRIDYSRGPNSILYGLGSPGGVVNTSTKQALMSNFQSVQLQASSWDGIRFAADWNRNLIDGKLAVRVNAMTAEKESWQNTKYKDETRAHFTVTYRPFSRTTLRAEYEMGNIDQNKPRPWGPIEGFYAWFNAGRPLVENARDPIPTGATRMGGIPRLSVNQSGGNQIMDWGNMARSNMVGYNYGIFDFDLVPRDFSHAGLGGRIDNQYETYSFFLEQTLFDDLAIELAYNFQRNEFEENRPINWNAPLYIDINKQLPDGSPNPNVGKFYLEDNYFGYTFDNEAETLRLTASYEFDFSERFSENSILKWFGRHRVAGLLEQRERRNARFNLRELNSTPIFSTTNWTAAANRIYRRTYVDFDLGLGLDGQIAAQLNPVNPQNVTAYNGTSGTVTPEIMTENFVGSITREDTEMLVLQSFFWKDRIVTAFGRREDTQKTRKPTVVRQNNILVSYDYIDPFGEERSGSTETKGVVFHALKWVSLFYNEAESFSLGNPTRFTIDGRPVGDERGTGKDYGLRFKLLEGKVYLSVAQYETASTNRTTFNAEGSVSTAADAIWEVINPAKAVDIIGGPASTEDLVSEGFEFEAVANLTDRWKLIFNFADSDVKTSNLFARNRQYVEDNRAEWQANANVPVEGSGNYTTVGEAIAFIDDEIATRVDPFNNRTKLGHADFKANLFTDYSFSKDGPLAGLSVGGGMRYVGENVIGYTAPDSPTYAKYLGEANTLVDFKVGYRRKLFDDKINWSIQLNIRNLFDNDDILLTLADTSGAPKRYRFQEPREWVITSTFSF